MAFNIKRYLGGDQRTIKLRKNIVASIAIKGINTLVYLLLVPLTLGYLNPYEYGVWLTMSSILMWINSFDIGLGNGLRNKLAIAIANGDNNLAKAYVSTTFVMLCIIVTVLLSIYFLCFRWIDWYVVLNTTSLQISQLDDIVAISLLILGLNFIFKFIGNVYLALQLPAINNGMVTGGHLLSLILIYVATKLFPGSLLLVAVIYTASPLIIYLFAYQITFFKRYRFMSPSLRYFRTKYLRELLGFSIQFFILQLSGILLFSMTNLIISRMFGADKVTVYNIAYRYFSIVLMIIGIILTPIWSATTDAYTRGDLEWIKRTMRQIKVCYIVAIVLLVFMLAASKIVYPVWIGNDVAIPFAVSILMAVYIGILVISLAYSNFLNGLGKLTIQTVNTIAVAILFCPVCFMLGRSLGIIGILLTMCLLNIPGMILNIIQFNKVMTGQAIGIWNR